MPGQQPQFTTTTALHINWSVGPLDACAHAASTPLRMCTSVHMEVYMRVETPSLKSLPGFGGGVFPPPPQNPAHYACAGNFGHCRRVNLFCVVYAAFQRRRGKGREEEDTCRQADRERERERERDRQTDRHTQTLSLIHISEPTRPY